MTRRPDNAWPDMETTENHLSKGSAMTQKTKAAHAGEQQQGLTQVADTPTQAGVEQPDPRLQEGRE